MPMNDLKTIRLQRSMNVTELAKKSGISRQTIYDMENGTRKNFQLSTLSRLADALDYPLDDIVVFFL